MDQEQLVEEAAVLVVPGADLAHALRHQPDQRRNPLCELATAAAFAVIEAPDQIVDHLHRQPELGALLAVAQRGRAQLAQPDVVQELARGIGNFDVADPLVDQRPDTFGDDALAIGTGPARIVAPIAAIGRRLERLALARDALDQLADVLGGARVLAFNLTGDDRRARLQCCSDDLDGANDRFQAPIQFAAAREVIGERHRDRPEMLDEPAQRTRFVAEIRRVEQRQRHGRLLQPPHQRLGRLGHPAIVDHVVEHRADDVENRQLGGRSPGLRKPRARTPEEFASRLARVRRDSGGVSQRNRVALQFRNRLQHLQRRTGRRRPMRMKRRGAQHARVVIRPRGARADIGWRPRRRWGRRRRCVHRLHRCCRGVGGLGSGDADVTLAFPGFGRQLAGRVGFVAPVLFPCQAAWLGRVARSRNALGLEHRVGRSDRSRDRCGQVPAYRLAQRKAHRRGLGNPGGRGNHRGRQGAGPQRVAVVVYPLTGGDAPDPVHVVVVLGAGLFAHRRSKGAGEDLRLERLVSEQRQARALTGLGTRQFQAMKRALRQRFGHARRAADRIAAELHRRRQHCLTLATVDHLVGRTLEIVGDRDQRLTNGTRRCSAKCLSDTGEQQRPGRPHGTRWIGFAHR